MQIFKFFTTYEFVALNCIIIIFYTAQQKTKNSSKKFRVQRVEVQDNNNQEHKACYYQIHNKPRINLE